MEMIQIHYADQNYKREDTRDLIGIRGRYGQVEYGYVRGATWHQLLEHIEREDVAQGAIIYTYILVPSERPEGLPSDAYMALVQPILTGKVAVTCLHTWGSYNLDGEPKGELWKTECYYYEAVREE